MSAKIQITIEYEPKIQYYPGCTTELECAKLDVENLNDGAMTLDEFASSYDVTIEAVE